MQKLSGWEFTRKNVIARFVILVFLPISVGPHNKMGSGAKFWVDV